MTFKHFIGLCFFWIWVAVGCQKEGAAQAPNDVPAPATRVALTGTDDKEVVRNVRREWQSG